jgi:hypothetical protein
VSCPLKTQLRVLLSWKPNTEAITLGNVGMFTLGDIWPSHEQRMSGTERRQIPGLVYILSSELVDKHGEKPRLSLYQFLECPQHFLLFCIFLVIHLFSCYLSIVSHGV